MELLGNLIIDQGYKAYKPPRKRYIADKWSILNDNMLSISMTKYVKGLTRYYDGIHDPKIKRFNVRNNPNYPIDILLARTEKLIRKRKGLKS